MASYLPDDLAVDQASIERQRQLAQLLQQQGLQAPQGQMVSGRYVAPSWTQYLAQGLANYRGQSMQADADARQKQLAQQLQGRRDAWLADAPRETESQEPMGPPTPDGEMGVHVSTRQPANEDYLRWYAKGMQIDPQLAQAGLSMNQKDSSPLTIKDGEVLLDRRTMKPIFENKKQETVPSEITEYKYAVSQGYPGSFTDWQLAKKKAGATNVNVKTDVKTGESLAKEVGPIMKDSAAAATGAAQQVDAAQRVVRAVDSNKLFTGPGANVKVKAAQIADALGIAGKDDAEKLANTRAAIRGLAELTLQGRQQMRGQGAITESEGRLAERAMSGEVSDLTAAEIRQLAKASERFARFNYAQHERKMREIRARPEFSGIAPFYEAPPLPPELPAASDGWSIKPVP